MKKYKVEIETLTPIHIWNWNTYWLLDFMIYEENWTYLLYRFDLPNLVRKLDWDLKEKIIEIIWENDFVKLKDFFSENYESLQEKVKDISKLQLQVSEYIFEKWKKNLDLKVEDMEGNDLNAKKNVFLNSLWNFQISEFINQRWKYYIPWSSLKGAIRSTILNFKDDNFSEEDIPNDPFKSIIATDSNLFSNIKVWEKYRAWAWTYLEYVDKGNKFYFEIILKEFSDWNDYRKLNINSEKDLAKKINYFTEIKLERYINWLKEMINQYKNNKNVEKKIKQFENLKNVFQGIVEQIKSLKDNECILSLWFGGWFWFKTYKERLWEKSTLSEKHPKFCSYCWEWEDKKFKWKHNSISWTSVESFNDNYIQIPRTWWKIQDENLWFIKLTFTEW